MAVSSDMQKIFIPTQPSLSIFSLLIPYISSKLRKAALSQGGMNIKFYLILTFLGPYFFFNILNANPDGSRFHGGRGRVAVG